MQRQQVNVYAAVCSALGGLIGEEGIEKKNEVSC